MGYVIVDNQNLNTLVLTFSLLINEILNLFLDSILLGCLHIKNIKLFLIISFQKEFY